MANHAVVFDKDRKDETGPEGVLTYTRLSYYFEEN